MLAGTRRFAGTRVAACNKVDLTAARGSAKERESHLRRAGIEEIHAVSALTGDGVAGLLARLLELSPAGDLLYPDDMYTDRPPTSASPRSCANTPSRGSRRRVPARPVRRRGRPGAAPRRAVDSRHHLGGTAEPGRHRGGRRRRRHRRHPPRRRGRTRRHLRAPRAPRPARQGAQEVAPRRRPPATAPLPRLDSPQRPRPARRASGGACARSGPPVAAARRARTRRARRGACADRGTRAPARSAPAPRTARGTPRPWRAR